MLPSATPFPFGTPFPWQDEMMSPRKGDRTSGWQWALLQFELCVCVCVCVRVSPCLSLSRPLPLLPPPSDAYGVVCATSWAASTGRWCA